MFKKVLTISPLVLLTSAATTSHSFVEFKNLVDSFTFERIKDTQDYVNCADIPIVDDVTQIIHDLKANPLDSVALFQDAVALYADYQDALEKCPKVVAAYKEYLAPVIKAFEEDPRAAAAKIVDIIPDNRDTLNEVYDALIPDIDGRQNYFEVGADLNTLVGILLSEFYQI